MCDQLTSTRTLPLVSNSSVLVEEQAIERKSEITLAPQLSNLKDLENQDELTKNIPTVGSLQQLVGATGSLSSADQRARDMTLRPQSVLANQNNNKAPISRKKTTLFGVLEFAAMAIGPISIVAGATCLGGALGTLPSFRANLAYDQAGLALHGANADLPPKPFPYYFPVTWGEKVQADQAALNFLYPVVPVGAVLIGLGVVMSGMSLGYYLQTRNRKPISTTAENAEV